MTPLRETADLPPPTPTLHDARAALAAEWQAADPRTDEDVASFYREARCIGPDLDAWHQHPTRQEWTHRLAHVARESGATAIIDIGAGAGHDLDALRDALPRLDLCGVEPNLTLRRGIQDRGIACVGDVQYAPIEDADLLVCVDVLEHVPHPEEFLATIATRAKEGCLLFETTATADIGTPLHLRDNWGWHPGRCLERHGWEVIDHTGRVRVWRRTAQEGRQRASILLCAYRSVNAEVVSALLAVCAGETGWRLRIKTGDALIARSRNISVTRWYHETNDDVFLMVDDDIKFTHADAERIADLCRGGHDIICGAYPVHDGGHMACRFAPETKTVQFGPGGGDPIPIVYAATGFMAVHRRVIDALVEKLPLCHPNQPWAFYPFFLSMLKPPEEGGVWEYLSEDWAMNDLARQCGFGVWCDPQTVLTHIGPMGVSPRNMRAIHHAFSEV